MRKAARSFLAQTPLVFVACFQYSGSALGADANKAIPLEGSLYNIFDGAEVLWAVATRSRWDRDLIVIPNMICTTRDPTAYAGSPGDLSYHAYTVAKGGIDATIPAPPEPFEIRIKVPDEVMRKVQLEDFVAKDLLSKIPPDA
jgi:3-polyprenyl-4-hydroxybenzoate decarboxylase